MECSVLFLRIVIRTSEDLVFSYEWQETHDPGSLDSVGNLALVLSASTSDTTWQDFTSFLDKTFQQINILVVYVVDVVSCDEVNLATTTTTSSLLRHVFRSFLF